MKNANPKTVPSVNGKPYHPLYSQADPHLAITKNSAAVHYRVPCLSCGRHYRDHSLAYPLDGAWKARLPTLRIASIVSSTVNNLVVLIALICPGATAATLVAMAAVSSGSSMSPTPSYFPKQ